MTIPTFFVLTLVATALQAQTPAPVWELGKNPIDPKMTTGKVDVVNGTVMLDGANTFALPASLLGAQNDYTVEFEVKRPTEMKQGCGISLVSNTDEKNKAGFGLNYFPPDYNACALFCNGYQTVEQRGFLSDAFIKLSFVAKDGRMTMFRNGLLLAITDAIKPSALPLVFGGATSAQRPPQSYSFRNIKIYNQPIFPTGFDQSAERMRNYSGDQYFMQRAEIKDPTRPRILVIGDSISMGYRSYITEHFKGKAYVDYWVGGGTDNMEGETAAGKRAWKGVLSNGPYTVVTWNSMSLHSWPKPERCAEETYAEIMTKYGIPGVDLYALCETKLDTVAKGSKDSVHWNQEVCKLMAIEIIKKSKRRLNENKINDCASAWGVHIHVACCARLLDMFIFVIDYFASPFIIAANHKCWNVSGVPYGMFV